MTLVAVVVVVVVITWGISRVFVAHSLASERGYLSDPPQRGCAIGSIYH